MSKSKNEPFYLTNHSFSICSPSNNPTRTKSDLSMNAKITKCSALLALFYLAFSAPLLCAQDQTAKEEHSATAEKLKAIKLPKVELKEVSFPEALEIIRKQSRLHDPEEDPEKKGVNFVVKGSVKTDRPITLVLTNVSLGDVLSYLNSLSGHSMKIQKNSVLFESAEDESQ